MAVARPATGSPREKWKVNLLLDGQTFRLGVLFVANLELRWRQIDSSSSPRRGASAKERTVRPEIVGSLKRKASFGEPQASVDGVMAESLHCTGRLGDASASQLSVGSQTLTD
jgi:hypothetical protein